MPPHATIVRKQCMIVSMMKKRYSRIRLDGRARPRTARQCRPMPEKGEGLPPWNMLPRKVDQSVNRQSELKRSSEVTDAADRRSLSGPKDGPNRSNRRRYRGRRCRADLTLARHRIARTGGPRRRRAMRSARADGGPGVQHLAPADCSSAPALERAAAQCRPGGTCRNRRRGAGNRHARWPALRPAHGSAPSFGNRRKTWAAPPPASARRRAKRQIVPKLPA